MEHVASSIVHAVCRNEKGCDLNPLPGTPSYSLTKLEQEAQDYMDGWQFFFKKVCERVWNVISIHAVCGGCIADNTIGLLDHFLMKRALSACCKSLLPFREQVLCWNAHCFYGGFKLQVRCASSFHRTKKGGICYTKGMKESEDDLELWAPLKY